LKIQSLRLQPVTLLFSQLEQERAAKLRMAYADHAHHSGIHASQSATRENRPDLQMSRRFPPSPRTATLPLSRRGRSNTDVNRAHPRLRAVSEQTCQKTLQGSLLAPSEAVSCVRQTLDGYARSLRPCCEPG